MKKFATLLVLLCSTAFTSYSQSYYQLSNSGTSSTYQDANGLVGIGTAAPSSSLTISDIGTTPSILEINRHFAATTDYSIMVAREYLVGSGPGTSIAMDFAVSSTGQVIIGADNSVLSSVGPSAKLIVAGDLATGGQILASSQIYTDGNLAIVGPSILNGDVTCNAALSVGSTTTLHDLHVTGGNTLLDHNLTVNGTTTLNSPTTLNSSLEVNGTTTLNDNVTIDGTLTLNSGIEAKGGIDLRNSGGTGYDPQIRFLSNSGAIRHLITDDVTLGRPGNLVIFPGWYGGGAPNTLEIAGKVGIGTSNVTTGSQLTVNGNADLIGSLKVSDKVQIGNTSSSSMLTIKNTGNGINLINDGYNGWTDQIKFSNSNGDLRHLIFDDQTGTGSASTTGNLVIYPGYNGNASSMLEIKGKVQIGNVQTSNTSNTLNNNYDLYVEKGIITEKVKVALRDGGNWSDYVFDDSYKLPTLVEVEKYIKRNKHLPGVPSADEVKNEGIDMATMDATLLKKIEELTLYVLALKQENTKINIQLNKLTQNH